MGMSSSGESRRMFFWREIQKADVLFEWQRNRTKKELFLVKGEDFNDVF